MSRHRRLVETDLGTVHVVVRSIDRDERPVLFLHMSPKSSRMYRGVMELLERPTGAIDRPGSGESDAPDHPPTMSEYAAASLAVADALGWEHFDVVGTHTGSVEAVEIAMLAPQRVGRVGVVAIPAYTSREIAARRRGVASRREPLDVAGDAVRLMWTRRIEIRPPPVDAGHARELFLDEIASLPTVHWAYEAVLSYPMVARLSAVNDLVVFAPRDDLWQLTRRARTALPAGAVFVELPHLDFDLWEKAPETMAELIRAHMPV